MPQPIEQVLTVAQMREAEGKLIDAGTSVDELMQIAGSGAADWIWRISGHHRITVLCGPGNNGGDGYVIAEAIRERGGRVIVVAAAEPKTDAALKARMKYQGELFDLSQDVEGDVLVDCLFGSGLTRPLTDEHLALLTRLAKAHPRRIAVDLPSGVESDSGAMLNAELPNYHATIALGAWKQAHFLMPATSRMGALRLVAIGCEAVTGAPGVIGRPHFTAPTADAHKYCRGLLGVVAGAMPGAALLSATAAQGAGAGYVRCLAEHPVSGPSDLVVDDRPLAQSGGDPRMNALLVGPGLGRGDRARRRLEAALKGLAPLVLDADALVLLRHEDLVGRAAPVIATPHEGELSVLERSFALAGSGNRLDRARALAAASGMVVVAKGPDSVVVAPDGRAAFAHRASSWLSTAGTGDVLAGIVASRLASGSEAFQAACEGVWLHGEAARLAGPAFSAAKLANYVSIAYADCL